jgi:hypothetical protein
MKGKENHFPNLAPHPIAPVILEKKTPQPFFGNVGHYRLGKKSLPCRAKGVLMQISCKHLDRGRLVEADGVFGKQYCDGIGFFPGGTTGDPYPNLFRRLLVFEEPGNFSREGFEGIMVPKEIGNAHEKVLNQDT